MGTKTYLGTLLFSYLAGIAFLSIGVLIIYKASKSTERVDGSILQPYLRAWFTGVGFFALGIVVIVLKLLGKE